ncbi:MAG: hypothetical protein WBA74_14725, partial [Cyclobacteriaceae bacterium]
IDDVVETDNDDLVFSFSYPQQGSRGIVLLKNNFIVRINRDGKEVWDHTLYRNASAFKNLIGIRLQTKGDKVYALYNDSKGNLDEAPDDPYMKAYNGSNSLITVQEISASGSVKKYPLTTNKALDRCAINFEAVIELEENYLHCGIMQLASMFKIDFKNITLRVE